MAREPLDFPRLGVAVFVFVASFLVLLRLLPGAPRTIKLALFLILVIVQGGIAGVRTKRPLAQGGYAAALGVLLTEFVDLRLVSPPPDFYVEGPRIIGIAFVLVVTVVLGAGAALALDKVVKVLMQRFDLK